MNGWFDSGGLKLARYLALPNGRATTATPALVLCHGFPVGPLDARQSAGTFPELIDRIATEMGWATLTFTFRGCGQSEGDFSLLGWLEDLRAAVDHLVDETGVTNVWLAGTSTGGSLVICEGAEDARVRGVAALAARADFDDWAGQPRRFLDHAREIGAVRSATFPPSFEAWARESARSDLSTRRVACRPSRCSSCTATTTSPFLRSTRVCWPRRTARPSCASWRAQATGFVTIPGRWPSSSAGSTASATG